MKRFVSLCLLVTSLAVMTSHASPISEISDLSPGRTLLLEGLVSGGTRTTGLALANLGVSTAQCSVSLTAANGKALGEVAVTIAPRSDRYLGDVFAGLNVAGAQAKVSCDQAFYAFAVIPDRETGNVAVVDPIALVEADAVTPCTPGSRVVCFDAKGILHQPTPAVPVKRVAFPVPPGTYGRVKMSLDVTVGPWYKNDPDAKHLVYWFVLNKNFDMLGMLYFRGPAAYTALSRYGIGLTHPKKIKLVKPFKAVQGHTYRCENDLDMAGGVINITVTDAATGEQVKLRGKANVSQLTAKAGDRFFIDMAFPENKTPDEVPSYNWTYKDIHVEAYPK
ncbi:MAG TPA: hypothetical protein VHC97_09845 [Thermoanaerobaculia bacterium]|jgi:hypothetical protein|nr:hypothetical protein [Thermoanaerobaculia bacterium]